MEHVFDDIYLFVLIEIIFIEHKVLVDYSLKLEKPHRIGLKTSHVSGLLLGLSQCVMFSSYGLSFWYGGKLINDGDSTFLDVMTVFMAIFLSGNY